jgi:hypothetical protein
MTFNPLAVSLNSMIPMISPTPPAFTSRMVTYLDAPQADPPVTTMANDRSANSLFMIVPPRGFVRLLVRADYS